MARPAPPSDDGSPARLIATMVGIVGILLLGSLAWSAVGALLSAAGAAGSALTAQRSPSATLGPPIIATPSPLVAASKPTALPSAVPTPLPVVTPTEPPLTTPTPETVARNPWILLPQPEPGSRVAPGPLLIEARGRGDVPIATIRLELDGAALPVSLEQRSESTWRGFANARVAAGQHAVRAVVTDADGRSGSFKWTFAAGP